MSVSKKAVKAVKATSVKEQDTTEQELNSFQEQFQANLKAKNQEALKAFQEKQETEKKDTEKKNKDQKREESRDYIGTFLFLGVSAKYITVSNKRGQTRNIALSHSSYREVAETEKGQRQVEVKVTTKYYNHRVKPYTASGQEVQDFQEQDFTKILKTA